MRFSASLTAGGRRDQVGRAVIERHRGDIPAHGGRRALGGALADEGGQGRGRGGQGAWVLPRGERLIAFSVPNRQAPGVIRAAARGRPHFYCAFQVAITGCTSPNVLGVADGGPPAPTLCEPP